MNTGSRLPRLAIGGILHETNTFSPFPTTLAAFRERTLLRGQAMVDAAAGSDSTLGGAIDAANDRAHLVPTLFASAMPGGRVSDETFATLAGDLLDSLRRAHASYPALDGVVMLLHGAMATASDDDPEATLLREIRAILGPERPLVAVIDSHASLSPAMVAAADRIIAYRTYPHLDTRARGEEAMATCLAMLTGSERPTPAFRKLPLLLPLLAQSTEAGSPLRPVLDRADDWRGRPGIAGVSLVPGFPYADVPAVGAAVLVYGDSCLANAAADDLAAAWWAVRDRFDLAGTPLAALPTVPGPGVTVLADIADNPGAGGTGDATHVLHHAIAHGFERAAFATIVDRAAVAACHEAGPGATLPLAIGGGSGHLSGEPVRAEWQVTHLGNGVFTNEGPMANGGTTRLGRTATVRHKDISVILCERRAQALDPSVFRAGGIQPEECRWLVVKSSVHYRAAFHALATTMIELECPGLSTSNVRSLTYTRVPRPIAPLDAGVGPAVLPSGQDDGHA